MSNIYITKTDTGRHIKTQHPDSTWSRQLVTYTRTGCTDCEWNCGDSISCPNHLPQSTFVGPTLLPHYFHRTSYLVEIPFLSGSWRYLGWHLRQHCCRVDMDDTKIKQTLNLNNNEKLKCEIDHLCGNVLDIAHRRSKRYQRHFKGEFCTKLYSTYCEQAVVNRRNRRIFIMKIPIPGKPIFTLRRGPSLIVSPVHLQALQCKHFC